MHNSNDLRAVVAEDFKKATMFENVNKVKVVDAHNNIVELPIAECWIDSASKTFCIAVKKN